MNANLSMFAETSRIQQELQVRDRLLGTFASSVIIRPAWSRFVLSAVSVVIAMLTGQAGDVGATTPIERFFNYLGLLAVFISGGNSVLIVHNLDREEIGPRV
jgi:hypothetical protein